VQLVDIYTEVWMREQIYCIVKKRICRSHSSNGGTYIHTVDLAGKCSEESATLLGGGRAWVYMEHELGGDR
jgi:hypothetical protein